MQIICHGLRDEDFSVEFTDHKIFIGRDESNSIVVVADGISRFHAMLIEEGEDLFLQDNDSLNGTFLNYEPIHDKQKLAQLKREVVVPEEEGFQDAFGFLFGDIVLTGASYEREVFAKIWIVGGIEFRAAVVEDGLAEVAESELDVSEVIEKGSVGEFSFVVKAFEACGGHLPFLDCSGVVGT